MEKHLVEKEKKEHKKKKIPKEISQEILKKIFGNLLKAVGVMIYFIILSLAYVTMQQERLIGDIEVFAGAFLVIGIVFLEKAYKKDNGSIAITGVEFLFLSLHSLSIMHVITLFQYEFRLYLLTSSYILSIYFVLKSIILYTKGRKDYLNSLSDISEIVKKEEPIKKEARKRSEEIEPKIEKEKEKEEIEEKIEENSQKETKEEEKVTNPKKKKNRHKKKKSKKKKR